MRVLLAAHLEDGPADLQVYLCKDPERQVVRLLEISEEFGDEISDTAWAVGFRASPEVPCQTATILLNPHDWQRVQSGDLRLPEEWPPECLDRVHP